MAYEAYWDDCVLALRFNGSSIVDSKSHTVTNTDVTLSTTIYDSGGKSGLFNGSTSGLEIAQGSGITNFGTADFTIPFSFYLDGPTGDHIILTLQDEVGYENGLEIIWSGDELTVTNKGTNDPNPLAEIVAPGVVEDTLYKGMLVRDGNTLRLFLNGAASGTCDVTGVTFGNSSNQLYVGIAGNGYGPFAGYIDEVYVVKGVALETAAYTPARFFSILGTGGPEVPLAVTVNGEGAPEIEIRVSVGSSGTADVGVSVSVIAAAYLSGGTVVSDGSTVSAAWSPVVEIDGVNVTASIIGAVDVEGSEGDARIASFSLAVASGTTIKMPDYVGKSVTVDIADSAGANRMRMFTGIVDLPDLDLSSKTIRFACTDDLQNRIAATTTDWLDGMIGGRWSPVVFDKGAGSWRYAQDQLSTVPASLDMSAFSQMRLTQWQAKTTPDLDFDSGDILDGSLSVDFAERSALVNQVDVSFGYRFPRMKSEGHNVEFSYLTNGFSEWVEDGNGFLFRTAVVSAINSAGGKIESITYEPLPTTAQVVGGGFWIPNPATDPLMCLGFEAVVSFDYGQDADELHTIRVYNDSSIAEVGLISKQISGSLVGIAADSLASETAAVLYRKDISKIPPPASAAVVSGSTNAESIALTTETNRAAAEAAMEVLIDVAKVMIAASHRSTRVSASLPLHPLVDVDKTIRVIAQGVTAKGKCTNFTHRMDAESGSATTDFTIALCSLSGLGIADAGEATVAPEGIADGVTSTLGDPVCVYDGLFGQDQSFAITFPEVSAAERNAAVVPIETNILAPLVEDVLTITL